METQKIQEKKELDNVYSRAIKAGKRIYYLDVKKARNEDLYVCITESKRFSANEGEAPTIEKHKIFLYKEDFKHFLEGLQDVMDYVKEQFGEIEDRQEWKPQEGGQEEKESGSKGIFESVVDGIKKII